MRSITGMHWVRIFAAAIFAITGLPTSHQAAESASGKPLRVMTFNLRFASDHGPNAWPDRRPVMRTCIQEAHPDLIGTQEGVYSQLKDIDSDLPDYDWIGLGREGGSHGEFMAVFYRRERFDPLEYDHFWLSDTPDVIGSSTWGNSNRRMVTWIRFRDRQTDRQFYLVNTHFDHQIQTAREKSAELLVQRAAKLDPKLPIVVTGDFNAVAKANRAYDILVTDGPFTDTWDKAPVHDHADLNSFHGFSASPRHEGARIDWILYRGPVEVERIGILPFQQNGQWPSDHFPVLAVLRFK